MVKIARIDLLVIKIIVIDLLLVKITLIDKWLAQIALINRLMVKITLIDQLLLKITLFDWLIDWLIAYFIVNITLLIASWLRLPWLMVDKDYSYLLDAGKYYCYWSVAGKDDSYE